jgi:N-acetylneuraminic acid mutarotase
VVWGGGYPSDTNAGGRYDPATDTWTPTSTVGAPTGRSFHSAVWTGSTMVVWGGLGPAYLNTGGRYDPAADSWTPTSTVDAPEGRYFHTAVWTGDLMIVWGGSFSFSSGGRYALGPCVD